MDPTERQKLIRKRAVVKSQLTRMTKFVREFDDETQSINEIQLRFEDLIDIRSNYDEIQSTLEVEEPEDKDHDEDREQFEASYYRLKDAMMKLLAKQNLGCQSGGSQIGSTRGSCNSVKRRQVKLPPITLPIFNGEYEKWLSFSDSFRVMVHENEEVPTIQKFQYLVSSCKAAASQLIQSIPITESNYLVAWKLLVDRYENKRLIASTHVQELMSLRPVQRECASELVRYSNSFSSNLNALNALKLSTPLHEVLLMHVYLQGLDVNTRKEWELKLNSQELPTLNELLQFVEHRRQALENIKFVSQTSNKQSYPTEGRDSQLKVTKPKNHSYVATQKITCACCKENHLLFKCPQFARLSVEERKKLVTTHKHCYNCLQSSHLAPNCTSSFCKKCGGKHHSLLHRESYTTATEQQKPTRGGSDETVTLSYHTVKGKLRSQVLLSTAMVRVMDTDGRLHTCRALLDSGSEANFVTERLAQTLNLKRHRQAVPIQGINNAAAKASHRVTVHVQAVTGNFQDKIQCLVLPHITGIMPHCYIEHKHWNLPHDIDLADPTFYQPGHIDMLLGAGLFFKLLRNGRMIHPGTYPILQETELGWILSGQVQQKIEDDTREVNACFMKYEDGLDKRLQKFWELEDVTTPPRTQEEIKCEQHFKEHTTRDEGGRYVVRLPMKEDCESLGSSYSQATTRLLQLERRLQRQPHLRSEYNKFMEEYEGLGHMKLVHDEEGDREGTYYLPHHPVIKESSTSTKTRVVFDASAKTTSGISLNDGLMVGPTVQQNLYAIILRFRTHPIAFTADIVKMYRQIRVQPCDTGLQRILWRRSPDEAVKIYELQTVTYGTASAPFLATKCLQQLAEDEGFRYPLAATVLRRDFYVDDVLSGCATVEEALSLQKELIQLLNCGGFPLHKWCANHDALLEAVPAEHRETQLPLQIDNDGGVKTLGLLWHPTTDKFLVTTKVNVNGSSTMKDSISKRIISSIVASIFDPLGLISPVVIVYKIFLQQMWLHKLSWDEQLPADLTKEWRTICNQLPTVNTLEIDRLVLCQGKPINIQVHGFCDASEKAYGACLYIRSINKQGETRIRLLCSKSRVAPVKKVTLPRLELCGAVLLAQLVHNTLPILELDVNNVYLWTDSSIVLSWIASPATRWNTFVANRVATIQEATHSATWKHVSSSQNPADLVSRGTTSMELMNSRIWWTGPEWLQLDINSWPSTTPTLEVTEEQRRIQVTLAVPNTTGEFMERYSTLSRLVKVTAYCIRFIFNTRNPNFKTAGVLTNNELHVALHRCIKIAQHVVYAQEIHELKGGKQVPKQSKLMDLHPFLDGQGMIRVGGRLDNSNLTYDAKHQLILPPRHHLTKLIILSEHLRLLHAGPQLLLASLRERYWIPTAKSVIKSVLHKCLRCFRLKARVSQQLMGNLPSHRVQPSRPFLNAGVDYAGPILIKSGNTRSKTTLKCYIAIFICLSTKAIHVEVVSSLSSEAFIAALKRFTARRGKSAHIYSDNGTNFVGANRELRELRQMFLSEPFNLRLHEHAAAEQLSWHFIPPSSPHFGGLWEAAVKSMKYHFKRVVGNNMLTFEELSTLTAQIEACLNSRPLTVLSDDPMAPSYLSPAHFLIGAPLTCLPEPDLTDLPLSKLSRWQRVQAMQQQLWRRWSSDYLNSLQQRTKWATSKDNLLPGAVVLIREDNLPPLQWRMGIITEVHPGKDGVVRVVTLRDKTGTLKRPIQKLVLLPTQ